MLPVIHPLAKTATDLRRSINRLLVYKEQNPDDAEVKSGVLDKMVDELKEVRRHIPRDFWDNDLA